MGKKERALEEYKKIISKIMEKIETDDEIISKHEIPILLKVKASGTISIARSLHSQPVSYDILIGKKRLYGYTVWVHTEKVGVVVAVVPVYKKYHVVGFALPYNMLALVKNKGIMTKTIEFIFYINRLFDSNVKGIREVHLEAKSKYVPTNLLEIMNTRKVSESVDGFFYHIKI